MNMKRITAAMVAALFACAAGATIADDRPPVEVKMPVVSLEPGGSAEVIVKVADRRGAYSEGPTPNALEASRGLVFSNIAVIEDRDGIWNQNPALSASTDLVLQVEQVVP